MKQHLRASSLQLKVVRVDGGRFGHASAGSRQEEQRGPVAPAAGRRLIRGCDDGLHLGVGEVMRHLDVGPFGGDRQNPWATPNEAGSAAATSSSTIVWNMSFQKFYADR